MAREEEEAAAVVLVHGIAAQEEALVDMEAEAKVSLYNWSKKRNWHGFISPHAIKPPTISQKN